jgi:hypothetical protein
MFTTEGRAGRPPSKDTVYAARIVPFADNITADAPQCWDCTWIYRLLDDRYWLKFKCGRCRIHSPNSISTPPLDVLPEPKPTFHPTEEQKAAIF